MLRKLFYSFILFCLTLSVSAQKAYNWTGLYVGPSLGPTYKTVSFGAPYTHEVTKYDPNFNPIAYANVTEVVFDQVTSLNVPGRGVVVVPGTALMISGSKSNKLNITGGIELGYRRQFNKWVGIIEGEFVYTPFKSSFVHDSLLPATALTYPSPYGLRHTVTSNLEGSIRVGVGYVLRSGLVYLTAGPIFQGMKITSMDYYGISYWPNPPPDAPEKHPTPQQFNFVTSYDNLHQTPFGVGFTIGIGYAFAISDNMELSIEYRYSRVSKTFTTNYSSPGGGSDSSIYSTYAGGAVAISTQTPIYNSIEPNSQKISFTSNQLTARLTISLDAIVNSSKGNKKQSSRK